jgi:hypothetical protein
MKRKTDFGTTLACTLALSCAIAFTGCSSSPQERAREVAVKALEASVDRPEAVNIRTVSRADSVFGRDYVTQDEKMAISMAMMKIGKKIMKETDSFSNFDASDRKTAALMERQMSAMSVLRSLNPGVSRGKEKKDFSGWKVKIDFEGVDADGQGYHSEYWFILDKEAQCVVKSFEIPLP